MENVIAGADVVQAGIHLTAATLAAMSPSVKFESMPLYALKYGMDASGEAHFGSLDWLKAPEAQSFFSATEEQVRAKNSESGIVQRPVVDLVISNPPYTRSGNDGGKDPASLAGLFSIPAIDTDSLASMVDYISKLLKGTPANKIAGHASSFTVLADRMVKPGGCIALVLPVTALFGQSWNEVREMLAAKYEIEFVVSSHDPALRSMSYDTGIAEALLVARRLREGENPPRRGKFVNLWKAAQHDTDALALVRVIKETASVPLRTSDGPPVGGSPLFVGGEQWGEVVEGPVNTNSWKPARWKRALVGQFASALVRGELWTEDGSHVTGRIPVANMKEVCNVGPQDRQIRGSLGVFDSYHGYNEHAQFPALWKHRESTHESQISDANAWLVPKPDADHTPIWSQSGQLHVTRDIQYDSQKVMATFTRIRALGVRAWHTLQIHEDDPLLKSKLEIALALWCNSSFGMALHCHHSNKTQVARGMGNKGMLETLATLDVRKLQPWQLEEAEAIWRDFQNRKFQPFYKCAIDPARIELDERLVRDVLGLGEDAIASVARLRSLLASEPSIHGSKTPQLPS